MFCFVWYNYQKSLELNKKNLCDSQKAKTKYSQEGQKEREAESRVKPKYF